MRPSKDKIAMILAQALFESEKRVNIRQQHLKSLQKIAKLVEQVPKLKLFLTNPMFSAQEKEGFLSLINTSKNILFFLNLVMKKHMISHFKTISNYYENLFFTSIGKIKTRIIVARSSDISKSTENLFIKKLEALTNKNVELEFSIDPTILGGFLLETNNLYIDSSLKKTLEDIKNSI